MRLRRSRGHMLISKISYRWGLIVFYHTKKPLTCKGLAGIKSLLLMYSQTSLFRQSETHCVLKTEISLTYMYKCNIQYFDEVWSSLTVNLATPKKSATALWHFRCLITMKVSSFFSGDTILHFLYDAIGTMQLQDNLSGRGKCLCIGNLDKGGLWLDVCIC